MLWSCNLSFCSSKIQCPQTKFLSGNRPFLSGTSSYLFLLHRVKDLPPFRPLVTTCMTDRKPAVRRLGSHEACALEVLCIISNSCGPFSRFENRIKWDRNDRGKRVTSKKRKFKFRDAHTERYRCKYLSRCSYQQKGGREKDEKDS